MPENPSSHMGVHVCKHTRGVRRGGRVTEEEIQRARPLTFCQMYSLKCWSFFNPWSTKTKKEDFSFVIKVISLIDWQDREFLYEDFSPVFFEWSSQMNNLIHVKFYPKWPVCISGRIMPVGEKCSWN